MHKASGLILCAALALSGAVLLGCDSKEDKGTVTPSDTSSQVHSEAAKDKINAAGDAMKDAGNNMKDAAKDTGNSMSEAARSARDKADAATATAPSAHVNVEVTPPTTRP